MIVPGTRPPLPASSLLLASLLMLPPGGAWAQSRPDADLPASSTPSTPSKTKKVADLARRYRFSERYTADDKAVGPGVVGPYRVAIFEEAKDSFDSPKGAPKRVESSRRAIFSERPAELGGVDGGVVATARAVEKYQARPEDASKMMGTRPLEGAAVLIRPKFGELPTILSLTGGRALTEYEFDALSKQPFVPHLAGLLPSQVVRLGDTWRVARKAAQALLGEPTLQGDTLVGKLVEVRKEVDGPRMVASIGISGKVAGPGVDTTINAEVLFTFQEPPPIKPAATKPGPTGRAAEDVTEARGAITEVRLGRVTTGPLPGPGRLRFQSNRELTLHRQLGLVAGGAAPPTLAKAPDPVEANAWLVHVDPAARYSLRHPQEMLPPDRSQPAAEPDQLLLIRSRREGPDMLQVDFFGKTLAPEDLKKELAEKYKTLKLEVLKGDESWLPEAEWPKMRVYRIDAALKVGESRPSAAGGSTRIHFDGYLIQFAQSSSILAVATTTRDNVTPYRREVEQILKSIQLDPARPTAN